MLVLSFYRRAAHTSDCLAAMTGPEGFVSMLRCDNPAPSTGGAARTSLKRDLLQRLDAVSNCGKELWLIALQNWTQQNGFSLLVARVPSAVVTACLPTLRIRWGALAYFGCKLQAPKPLRENDRRRGGGCLKVHKFRSCRASAQRIETTSNPVDIFCSSSYTDPKSQSPSVTAYLHHIRSAHQSVLIWTLTFTKQLPNVSIHGCVILDKHSMPFGLHAEWKIKTSKSSESLPRASTTPAPSAKRTKIDY